MNRFEEARLVLSQWGYKPDSGTPFEEQVFKIGERLQRLPALPAGEINTGNRAIDYCEVLAATLQKVQVAATLIELQRNLVIINVNEFKLRLRPTEDQLLDLLRDFKDWELRWRNRWTGTDDEIKKAEELLDQVIAAVKAKYSELAAASAG